VSENAASPAAIKVAVFHHQQTTTAAIRHNLEDPGGFEVTSHENPLLGLAQLSRDRPQVVLLDIEMPIIDGFQILSLMRSPEYPSLAHMPVVLMGKASMSAAHRARELGAAEFLAWPAEPEVLRFALQRAVSRSEATAAGPAVVVCSAADKLHSQLAESFSEDGEIDVVATTSMREVLAVSKSRSVELIVLDSALCREDDELLDRCRKAVGRVPILVAETTAPDPKWGPVLLATGAADLVPAHRRGPQLAAACLHQLRRSRAASATPGSRDDALESFFDASSQPLVLAEAGTGRIRAANDPALRALRRPRHELERMSIVQLAAPESREAVQAILDSPDLAVSSAEAAAALGVEEFHVVRLGWAGLLLVTMPGRRRRSDSSS
jgi:DNA-binding response OmpR family regulator